MRLSAQRRWLVWKCDWCLQVGFFVAVVCCGLIAGGGVAVAQDSGGGNGVSVGQPKVYDNQSLTIMLDELNAQLNNIKTIDASSVLKALATTQGSQQTDVQRAFMASLSLTPAAANAASPGASSNSSSANNSSGNGSSNSGKSSSDSGNKSSSTSALPGLLAAPDYKPTYGENSEDLLSDQVDLTYQIFNLRMVLERSVSDRLLGQSPRRQAVVGFNISVDPPRDARDAAAYVEITLSDDKGPISLVASMPQEKTYNATALSTSANAFGGAAAVKIFSLNYNQEEQKQTFFLYRDCDTQALEWAPAGNSVRFGWVFRPVLGRRSVSPGMRQMFAVIALPETDGVGSTQAKDSNGQALTNAVASQVHVSVKTYWMHYDKDSSTTQARRGFWHWYSKPPNPAEYKPDGNLKYADIVVPPTHSIEDGLRASVSDVKLFQTTEGNTVMQITGDNFFSGTSVTIGDKTFAGAKDGLMVKSSQTMMLTANEDVLSHSWRGVVNGRYGPAVALYPKASPAGIVIAKSAMNPKGPNFTELELVIDNGDFGKDLTPNDIRGLPDPVLSLNGALIPYRPYRQPIQDTTHCNGPTHHCLDATVTLPNSLMKTRDNRAGIIFPLLGDAWAAEDLIYDADEVQLTKMTNGSTTTLLISRPGNAFNKDWTLVADKTYALVDPPPKAAFVPAAAVTATQHDAGAPTRTTSASGGAEGAEAKNTDAAKGADKDKKNEKPKEWLQFSTVTACKKADENKDSSKTKNPEDKKDCYMLKVVADTKTLSSYQKLVLVSHTGYAQILDLPAAEKSEKAKEAAAPAAAIKPTGVTPATVGLNEVVTVIISGTGLDGVKQVSFDGKALTFWALPEKKGADAKAKDGATANGATTSDGADAKTSDGATSGGATDGKGGRAGAGGDAAGKTGQIEVMLTRDVTSKEGRQELLLQGADTKNVATIAVMVSPAPSPVTVPKK